jgi:hypothetical protein
MVLLLQADVTDTLILPVRGLFLLSDGESARGDF